MQATQQQTDESQRERRMQQLIARLPGRIQPPVQWLLAPSGRYVRIPAGLLLMLGGVLAILPIFGLWMLPLGFLLLAEDIPPMRRLSARALGWVERRHPTWLAPQDHRPARPS